MPVIDAHIHCFPDRLAVAVRNRLNSRGGLTGGVLVGDIAERVEEAGLDQAWVLPYAHKAGVAETVNEWSATEVARFPRLVAGATFHPADENIARLVERALVELGLRVVKLHCSVGQFSPADPRLDPLWETAARLGVPIVTHAGVRHGGDTAADELDNLVPVLRSHPDLNLVLAHSGHPATSRCLALMEQHPNLYGDLTPVWDRPPELATETFARFPGRFLLGTDTPNSPAPIADHLDRVRRLGLPEEELQRVLGGTAAALTSR